MPWRLLRFALSRKYPEPRMFGAPRDLKRHDRLTRALLAEVSEALRDRDAPRLREAAHKVRGLLSAFSRVAGSV